MSMIAPKIHFATIAVATDLSDASSSALRYAQSIARTYQSTLVLIHVIDPMAYAFPNGAPTFPASKNTLEDAREELARIEDDARNQGITVHSVLESGVVCERILASARKHHADLLVLGTRSQTEAGRVALGTVARQLLARADFPIMTVSPDAALSMPWAGRCRRVLAATDFSSASIAGLQFARQLAQRHLTTLHVSRCKSDHGCLPCQDRLRALTPEVTSMDISESTLPVVPIDHILVSGNAGERIAEYAEKTGADLVVLGSPVNELSEGDFHTSTVLQVISKVACPVLCVPFTSNQLVVKTGSVALQQIAIA
jgi:nucleotide-binding universal stress UspA family protein